MKLLDTILLLVVCLLVVAAVAAPLHSPKGKEQAVRALVFPKGAVSLSPPLPPTPAFVVPPKTNLWFCKLQTVQARPLLFEEDDGSGDYPVKFLLQDREYSDHDVAGAIILISIPGPSPITNGLDFATNIIAISNHSYKATYTWRVSLWDIKSDTWTSAPTMTFPWPASNAVFLSMNGATTLIKPTKPSQFWTNSPAANLRIWQSNSWAHLPRYRQ